MNVFVFQGGKWGRSRGVGEKRLVFVSKKMSVFTDDCQYQYFCCPSCACQGLPSKIEGARKEILEGHLLGSFKSSRAVIRNVKTGHIKLIKRCCLDDLQDKFNVLCFMHFEATAAVGGECWAGRIIFGEKKFRHTSGHKSTKYVL